MIKFKFPDYKTLPFYIFVFLYILLQATLISEYGSIAILWSSIGFIIGVFATSFIFIPIIMGYPLAIYKIFKKEISPIILLVLLISPIIWLSVISIIFSLIDYSTIVWLQNNPSMIIGHNFGFIAVLLSPLSKKTRNDNICFIIFSEVFIKITYKIISRFF